MGYLVRNIQMDYRRGFLLIVITTVSIQVKFFFSLRNC